LGRFGGTRGKFTAGVVDTDSTDSTLPPVSLTLAANFPLVQNSVHPDLRISPEFSEKNSN
jgi:hypothetical protein